MEYFSETNGGAKNRCRWTVVDLCIMADLRNIFDEIRKGRVLFLLYFTLILVLEGGSRKR